MSKHSQILDLARQLVAALEASAPAPRKKVPAGLSSEAKVEPKVPDVSASSDAEVKTKKPPRKPAAKKAPSPPVVPEPSS